MLVWEIARPGWEKLIVGLRFTEFCNVVGLGYVCTKCWLRIKGVLVDSNFNGNENNLNYLSLV